MVRFALTYYLAQQVHKFAWNLLNKRVNELLTQTTEFVFMLDGEAQSDDFAAQLLSREP